MKTIAPLLFSVVLMGCGGSGQKVEPLKEGGLELRLDTAGNRVLISLVNTSGETITINRLFRAGGQKRELTFRFEGKEAEFAHVPGMGFVEPDDLSEPTVNLKPGESYGTSLRPMDMKGLFGLEPGDCRLMQVVYKDPIPVPDAYQGAVVSNSRRICISQ